MVYSIVYQKLLSTPGLLALWCGSDQKHWSDQKDAGAGLNPHCKGHGSLHYSSGSHAKARGVSRKQREGQRMRDRGIDLERRPPFSYLSSHRDPCQKSSFAAPKAPALLWIENKGWRQNEAEREREAEEGEHLSEFLPWFSRLCCLQPSLRYGTKQKDAPECDTSNGTLMSAPLRSKTPRPLAKMSRLAKNTENIHIGRLPWNDGGLPRHQLHQQQLGIQPSPCHLTRSRNTPQRMDESWRWTQSWSEKKCTNSHTFPVKS